MVHVNCSHVWSTLVIFLLSVVSFRWRKTFDNFLIHQILILSASWFVSITFCFQNWQSYLTNIFCDSLGPHNISTTFDCVLFWSVPASLSGGEGGEGGGKESPPALKRNNSARNVAKLLKKTISRHNLHSAASESTEAHTPNTQHTQVNGQTPSNHTNTNGHAHTVQEQDSCTTDHDHQVETVNQKHNRKKDSCSLATVTEETSGDGEAEDR